MKKSFLINQLNQAQELRWLSVLFALMLLPMGAWAEDYNIVVGGVQVTSDNAANITGDHISGTVSFDAGTNTLTLDNATIDMTDADVNAVTSALENMTVRLVGFSTIRTFANSNDPRPFVYTGQNAETESTLTFVTDEAPDVSGKLSVEGIGSTENLATGYVVNTDFAELRSAAVEMDQGDEIEDGWKSYTANGTLYIWNFIRYDLWIGGYRVTTDNINGGQSGVASYQPATHTLPIDSEMGYTVKTGLAELIIEVGEGQCGITSYDQQPAISFEPVEGGPESGSLVIRPSATGEYHMLTLSSSAGAIVDFSTVSGENGMILKEPQEDPGVWTADYQTVVFGDYDDYNIAIYTGESYEAVSVTNLNAADVLGDGTVSYNPDGNILTLNNATIAPTEVESPAIVYTGTDDLTIMLVGTNRIQGGGGCEAIRYDNEQQIPAAPKFIFATDEENPGKLICSEGYMFDSNTAVEYQNGLGLTTTAEGQMVGYFRSYNLWVMGTRVTSMNKENVLGDANATVRFNPQTNTLSLYGANLVVQDSTTIVRSAVPALIVDLHGNNRMKFANGFASMLATQQCSLTFTTSTASPGQLSWETFDAGAGNPVFATGFDVTCQEPLRSFSESEGERLISVATATTYELMVGSTAVTSTNCTDILGNGGTVKYAADSQTLVLEGAYLNDKTITSRLAGGLTIYLLGANTISGAENLIVSTVDGASLTFASSDTKPGSLTLTKTADDGTWIDGFADPAIPSDYATATDGNTMTIAHPVPITPIVAETENGDVPETNKTTDEFYWETTGHEADDYLNVVVNNVLYTLKAGDYNEGDYDKPDDPSGVNLTEVPADMDAVLTKTPGSDDYADAFKGLTIEVPAGNGQVLVTGEIGAAAKLAVKIGNDAPVLFPNDDYPNTGELETIVIPYSCSENTFVYVYLASTTATTARAESPFRGRVLTGHVKITSVGASSSLVVNTNSYSSQANTVQGSVVAYAVPAGATTSDNHGVVMSTVDVETTSASARGVRRAPEKKKITQLGNSVFDSLDKDQILFIDLSGTAIQDMTVNRSAGLFDGFGQNTLFYLPADNDDGGEANVVLGDNCAHLSLVDKMDFRAPNGFTAAKVDLERTFTAGKTSTVFLPFGLSKAQADAIGAFHTFKAIDGPNAVFNEAETNGTTANTPYVFVPTAEKIEVENVGIVGYDDFSAVSGNMIGTYEQLTWATEQTSIYGFAAADLGEVAAGQFVRVGAGAWMPPFRAFIQVESAPARLNLMIDDVTTGISSLASYPSPLTSEVWFTISGQRLSGQPSVKGLYVNNGKKISVK